MQSYGTAGATSPSSAYVAGGLIGSPKPKVEKKKPQPRKVNGKNKR